MTLVAWVLAVVLFVAGYKYGSSGSNAYPWFARDVPRMSGLGMGLLAVLLGLPAFMWLLDFFAHIATR